MRSFALAAALALALSCGAVQAQQVVDPNPDVGVAHPDWPKGAGPRVLVDAAHNNFHTIDGNYAPFAHLLENDGYRVSSLTGRINAESLAGADVLVIVNPQPLPRGRSPFSAAEGRALREWVEGGGRLFLILDHMPFPEAARPVTSAFGLDWRDGYVRRLGSPEIHSVAEHTLADNVITAPVTSIRAFLGSAFVAPAGATVLMSFDDHWRLLTPPRGTGVQDLTPRMKGAPVTGLVQSAAWPLGKGRVILHGEAAMFSAQLSGPQQRKAGFTAPGAEQNKAFLLNLMRWLSAK